MKKFSVILATTTDGGIGFENKLVWNIPEELMNFKNITSKTSSNDKINCVIMGKNTWNSIHKKPLSNRFNIIISSSISLNDDLDNVVVKKNITDAIEFAEQLSVIDKIFIIGGASIYKEVFDNYMHVVDKIYLSIIFDKFYQCDKYVNMQQIYDLFHFEKQNIKVSSNYIYMIGDKKTVFEKK